MNGPEAQTRQEIIDRKLALAGWNVKDPSQVIEELDIYVQPADGATVTGTPGSSRAADASGGDGFAGHQFADYALLRSGNPLAVVEAKKSSIDARVGQEQALQYAQNLQRLHGGSLPFVCYTNGYDVYFWDSDFYPPVKVGGFPTRNDLEWMAQRHATRGPLSVELINTDIAGRDYQIQAIRSVLEGVEAKRRKFLLVMATGTGKTRVAVGLADVLMRAHWCQRVLFLVDRIALRDQSLDAFKEHLPSEPVWPGERESVFARGRRIYVATYPTMQNLIEKGMTPESWISPYYFDLVIADESHRSIYNVYRQVLDYFDAIKLGLTATPTDRIDHDTFTLFDRALHDPTFAYQFEDAIAHDPPYLNPFEVLNVRSKFQVEGIHGRSLPPVIQRQLEADGRDLDEIDFEGTDLERKVTNSGTNALIVREFMEESIKDPDGVLPGKSIIFAVSKAHARRLQDIFDALYPEHQGKLARVLVSDDSRVHGKGGLLDQFKTQDYPRVAISVDMLDTGVDIREVVNLVFAKPVYSYVKFWQMIGRGTRVLEEDPAKRRPWCPEKDRFLIVDCWGNFDYFDLHPKGREPGSQTPVPVRLFRARLDKLEVAMASSADEVAEMVKGDLRLDIGRLPSNNVVVEEGRRDLDRVADDAFWIGLNRDGLSYLRGVIAPLMRARSTEDFKALRFEVDVVDLGTAHLAKNGDAFEAAKQGIVEQVEELPLTVNVVARERALIEKVKTEHWWANPSEPKFAELIERLAHLMKYRGPNSNPMVKLDIVDLLQLKEWVEVGPEHERMSTGAYRDRVEAFVKGLVEQNLVLRKIRDGLPIESAELDELAGALSTEEPYITEEALRRAYDNRRASFLDFIRHILGLAPIARWSEEVTGAFDDFIAEHNTYNDRQIRFLQTVRTFILQSGHVDRADLVAPPFTNIHPQGIRGIFQPNELNEVLDLVAQLSDRAA